MTLVTKDLRDGVKQLLVDGGIPTGVIFLSKMPANPDRIVVLSWYPVSIPHTHGIQARCRGLSNSTTSAEDLAAEVKAILHGVQDQQWGDTKVELLSLQSAARIGFDISGRDEVALNFYAITSEPSTSLVDIV